MRLYMKQKIFSLVDRFYIKDENGQDRYYVEGEFFTLGKKFHLYDMNGVELAFIQQKLLTFLPKFFVYQNGNIVAEIVKEFTFLKPRYRVDGLDWEVDGEFLSHDYYVRSSGYDLAYVHKVWMSWGDSYEIDLNDSRDTVLTLAVVLAIDAVMDAAENSNSSST